MAADRNSRRAAQVAFAEVAIYLADLDRAVELTKRTLEDAPAPRKVRAALFSPDKSATAGLGPLSRTPLAGDLALPRTRYDRFQQEVRAQSLRAAVNSPRVRVVAIVAGLTGVGGALAGGVAALIAAAALTPSEPVSVAQIAAMALGYGLMAGVGGAVLGTAVGFGALRRVPLGRLLLCTNVGLAAGLTAGWVAGPWAWHHMLLLGVIGFSAGAALSHVLTQAKAGPPTLPTNNSDTLSPPNTLDPLAPPVPGSRMAAPPRVAPRSARVID
ncbi:MAG: hypothetical protein U0163_17145 [Gemmatimonadaceae bacterium]